MEGDKQTSVSLHGAGARLASYYTIGAIRKVRERECRHLLLAINRATTAVGSNLVTYPRRSLFGDPQVREPHWLRLRCAPRAASNSR